MLRPLSPHLKSSLRHLIISFIILSPVMFSAYLFFDFIGLNPDLILLKLKGSFILHGLRSIFRLFGLEIPIFFLLSIVGSVVGSSLHMQDPAGGQPAANPASEGTHRPHLAGAADPELAKMMAPSGAAEGGFSQPPTPTPPPENSGLGLIPGAQSEGDRPNSNHYPSGSSQEAHQEGQRGSSPLAPHQDEAGSSGTAPTEAPPAHLTTKPDEQPRMEPPGPQTPPTRTPPNDNTPPKDEGRSPAKEIMLSGAKGIAQEAGKCFCQGGLELCRNCLGI